MIKAVKKDTGNVLYMRLKSHNCPQCSNQLKVVKFTKVVKAKTKEAKNFDFTACDASLGEKVKFIWYEFKCKNCDKTYTESEMKAFEKAEKAKEMAQKKAEKAKAKAEAKARKKAEKKATVISEKANGDKKGD